MQNPERFLNQNLISFIIRKSLKSLIKSYGFNISNKFIVDRLSQREKMHILQPKHIKLKEKEVQELLKKFNISKAQLPKILLDDPALPEGCEVGDIIKIERKEEDKTYVYYRVVI